MKQIHLKQKSKSMFAKTLISILIVVSTINIKCNKCSTPIDDFFNELEKYISNDDLIVFKNAQKDSVLFYFKKFESEFSKAYQKKANLLNNFFKNINIIDHKESRLYYLCFAFHSKLNCKKFDNDEIIQFCNNEFLKTKNKWNEMARLFALRQYEIMQNNNKRWNIGDIITLNLPVISDNGVKSACYCYTRLTSLDCSGFNDSLMVNGKLTDKQYFTHYGSIKIDTNEIIFKLKILNISKLKYRIFNEEYEIGDTLDVYLNAYGRPIF